MSGSSFYTRSSNHFPAQTKRARELKFWEKVSPQPCVPYHVSHVTCHMSGVTCHISCVMCPMSHFFYFFYYFFLTDQWRVCFQGSLPRLFFFSNLLYISIRQKSHIISESMGDSTSITDGQAGIGTAVWTKRRTILCLLLHFMAAF